MSITTTDSITIDELKNNFHPSIHYLVEEKWKEFIYNTPPKEYDMKKESYSEFIKRNIKEYVENMMTEDERVRINNDKLLSKFL